MKLSKPLKNKRFKPTDWFAFITNDDAKLVIPVGPRFQADVPPWTPSVASNMDNSKWIDAQIWPQKSSINNHNNDTIGRGRPESCECTFPGSIECVKKHVSRKRFQLRIDLGPVFWIWRFDEMGEDVSKLWNLREERTFEYIVKMGMGKSLVKSALESLPGKGRRSIVSYYQNVYIPRRMSVESRSSCIIADLDDEEDEDDANNLLHLKRPRNKLRTSSFKAGGYKRVKSTYLTSQC